MSLSKNSDHNAEKLHDIKNIITVITSKMVLPLYMLFWIPDIFYVPDRKWEFLAMRAGIIPVALIVNFWIKRVNTLAYAQNVALLYIFILASGVNNLILVTNADIVYDKGIHLIAIGALSFLPWTTAYFFLTVLAIYLPFFIIKYSFTVPTLGITPVLIDFFFVFALVSITYVIKIFHENFRNNEKELRFALEAEMEKTKNAENALIQARDQALEGTKAKSRFLANMSHELRTPLTAIVGFSDILQNRKLNSDLSQKYSHTVYRNAQHLLKVINDILDISKIEAGKLEVNKDKCNLFSVVSDVQALMQENMEKKGLQLEIDYSFPLPSEIVSDEIRIKQILINLCGNAAKFTSKGKVTLNTKYNNDKNQIVFSVSDTGIGMTQQQLSSVFNAFIQADSSTTKNYGGTGLGLSISRQLAEMLGGDISATSKSGEGSTFIFTLDPGNESLLEFVDAPSLIHETQTSELSLLERTEVEGHILLVDDTQDNLDLIGTYLVEMNAVVTFAHNGIEALKKCESATYDLILIDMQMPKMGGIEAVQKLRQRSYSKPIVMLTGNAFEEAKKQSLEAGCNGFLTKPVEIKPLVEVVLQNCKSVQEAVSVSHKPAVESIQESEKIVSQMKGKSEKYDKLIERFVNELPNYIADIQMAIEANSYHQIKENAHRLKGVCGNYGFPQIAELCQNMEVALIENNKPQLDKILVEIKSKVNHIII